DGDLRVGPQAPADRPAAEDAGEPAPTDGRVRRAAGRVAGRVRDASADRARRGDVVGPVSLPVRIGQIGTKHGHARGKWRALMTNPDVEAAGIWEPDAATRTARQG